MLGLVPALCESRCGGERDEADRRARWWAGMVTSTILTLIRNPSHLLPVAPPRTGGFGGGSMNRTMIAGLTAALVVRRLWKEGVGAAAGDAGHGQHARMTGMQGMGCERFPDADDARAPRLAGSDLAAGCRGHASMHGAMASRMARRNGADMTAMG